MRSERCNRAGLRERRLNDFADLAVARRLLDRLVSAVDGRRDEMTSHKP